jgi:membrane protein YdbS with pleckstrin-like domain
LFGASFTSGNAHKIEGVSASETSKFKCTIAENAEVRTGKF